MLFSKRDVANLLRRKLKNGLFGSSCGRSRKCSRYSKSEKRKATTAGSDNIISNPKALLQGFILTPCESRDSFIVYYNGVRTQIQRRINGALNNAKRSGIFFATPFGVISSKSDTKIAE